jgi:hypothetical protein
LRVLFLSFFEKMCLPFNKKFIHILASCRTGLRAKFLLPKFTLQTGSLRSDNQLNAQHNHCLLVENRGSIVQRYIFKFNSSRIMKFKTRAIRFNQHQSEGNLCMCVSLDSFLLFFPKNNRIPLVMDRKENCQ